MTLHEELLKERNTLLRESVELQREQFAWQKRQATEQKQRLGDFVNDAYREGIKDALSELRTADIQSIPTDDKVIMEHVRKAIKQLEPLLA